MDTEKKVFLISGGSRGLGQAMVSKYLENEQIVATFSRSSTPFIQECLKRDPEQHTFMWQSIDIRDHASIKKYVTKVVRHYGRLDVLVNNAGIGVAGILPMMRIADIDTCIDLNLKGPIYLIQVCSRFMLQQQFGCIVNISSVNAIRGHAGVAVYSAAKAALDGLTRSLAKELGPKNIRVNSVAPGYFESKMVETLSETEKQRIIRKTPLTRLGTVEEVTSLILFLTSPHASFITGQTITIDGGLTC